MAKPIGILGIGQAGGNIAEVAESRGYQTGAINTSPQDLDSLRAVKGKYHIPGWVGAGKNRTVGIEAVSKGWGGMVDFVKDRFSEQEMVYVAFSLGGGTGSGVSPILLDILTDAIPSKKWGAIVVLPDSSESVITRVNTAQAFGELTGIEKLGSIIIIDNDKVRSKSSAISRKELYHITNQQVIALLDRALEVTTLSSTTANLDRRDLFNILMTRGILSISEFMPLAFAKESDINPQRMAQMVMESWENGILAPIEYGQVIRAGLVWDGPDTVARHIDPTLIFKETGLPLEVFEGSYTSGNGRFLSILAGLPYPAKRLGVIEADLEKNKDRFKAMVDQAYGGRYESKVADLIQEIRTPTPAPAPTAPKDSILSKLAKYQRGSK